MDARSGDGDSVRWRTIRPVIRAARGCVWAAIACAYGVVVFGWAWRAGGGDMSRLEGWAALASLWIQTFAFHGGLMLLGVLGAAVAVRMKWGALALLPVLAWTLGPAAWSLVRPLPEAPAPGTPVLTVFSANVLYTNTDTGGVVDQIDREKPDIVLLQEFNPRVHTGLEAALRERYAHARVWPQQDAFGQAVFSAIPFEGEPTLWWGGDERPLPQLEFEIEFDGRRVAVWNIHPLPPSGVGNLIEQRAMVVQIASRARALLEGEERPDAMILAGDFNAPFHTNHVRELRALGLRDAHASAGRGRGGTFPRSEVWRVVPRIDIDHVTHTGGLRCVGAWVGEGCGSDHLPVGARLVWEGGQE